MKLIAWMILISLLCPDKTLAVEVKELSDDVVTKALAGPMKDIEEIIFVTRAPYVDSHWYANFGYYGNDEKDYCFAAKGEDDIGKICKLNLRSGQVEIIFNARGGSVRDPQTHYEAGKILFSYRKTGTIHYHLYEINVDGSNLKQLTYGDFDDIEASYLPDGGIVFVSSRSRQWTGCLPVQVGNIYRCDGNGENITRLSSNIEHDNTPWIMPDGRILHTRWEYIDRNWMYHHLWTMNPDGSNQMVYYGNMHAKIVMIDAKPIPGTNRIVASLNDNHGKPAHYGHIAMLTGDKGPDDLSSVDVFRGRLTNNPFLKVEGGVFARDPYPISEDCFLLADKHRILIMDGQGRCGQLYASSKNEPVPEPITEEYMAGSAYLKALFARRYLTQHYSFPHYDDVHEPRPLIARQRETKLYSRIDPGQSTGFMSLLDVYKGRNMSGVKRGDIKKLLVIEALPKPVSFTGPADMVSFEGTHTLERVLGTVPVEADGSAYFEVPAKRPLFFVALDADDMSVKRMQSFTTAMPGETMGCIGCHDHRTDTPDRTLGTKGVMATKRVPSKIEPFTGFPDVLDFTRDIQPILDRHCESCHNFEKREGNVVLESDLGAHWSHSYFTLFARDQVADGRHGLGNQPPRSIGSAASRLLEKLSPPHFGVEVTDAEWRTVWLWIESAAPYAGSYGALRNTEAIERAGIALLTARYGKYSANNDPIRKRCGTCHKKGTPLEMPYDLARNHNSLSRKDQSKPGIELLNRTIGPNERVIVPNDPIARFGSSLLYNFTRPEKSPILLAPLSRDSGGWGRCPNVFKDKSDPDYKEQLLRICRGKDILDSVPRYTTKDFKPNRQYIREMKKYGILPIDFDIQKDQIDIFATDQRYWSLLWYKTDKKRISK